MKGYNENQESPISSSFHKSQSNVYTGILSQQIYICTDFYTNSAVQSSQLVEHVYIQIIILFLFVFQFIIMNIT